jgi:hypothetical protein
VSLVPSYVSDRNGAATRAGLEVSATLRNDCERVNSIWLGNRAQFEATGMRFDKARWSFKRSRFFSSPFHSGTMVREGDDLFSLSRHDELPRVLRVLPSGITMLEFEPWLHHHTARIEYHGTEAQLIQAGLIEARRVPRGMDAGKRPRWGNSGQVGEEFSWNLSLCFDGKLIYEKNVFSDALREQWAKNAASRAAAERELREISHEERTERKLQAEQLLEAREDAAFQALLRRIGS